MDLENNDEWLREIAGQLRAAEMAYTPPFEPVWRSAERRSAQRNRAWVSSVPRLALGFAAVLTVCAFVFWNSAGASKSTCHGTEHDLAALDSVLVTYWEAPSDVLLEPFSPDSGGRVQ